MNKEAIGLLKEAKTHLQHNFNDELVAECIDQVLTLLKQQPEPSEFTEMVRWILPPKSVLREADESSLERLLHKALDRLDRQATSLRQLEYKTDNQLGELIIVRLYNKTLSTKLYELTDLFNKNIDRIHELEQPEPKNLTDRQAKYIKLLTTLVHDSFGMCFNKNCEACKSNQKENEIRAEKLELALDKK